MGNKLDAIKHEDVPHHSPQLWFKYVLVERFAEFEGYFKKLPAHMQTQIRQAVNFNDLFKDKAATK